MTAPELLRDAIAAGNRNEAKRLTQLLLDSGTTPPAIVDASLVPGMAIIGERFKCNEAFVPEMLMSARAMKECMAMLEPLLVKAGYQPRFTAVLGTVAGDLHDIGKNLVAMMWRGANIGVVDLGVNVPANRFVAAVREHHARLVGLSALLTTTMPAMTQAVRALRSAGLDAKVLIGGAPVTRAFADSIGADGFAPDAASAVDAALAIVGDAVLS